MTKKRCKIKLCLVAVLTLIGLFLTFFSFVLPTTNTTFKGFINAIDYGYDLAGGRLATYKVSDDKITGEVLDKNISTSVEKLNSCLNSYGVEISKQDKTIRVQLSNSENDDLNALLSGYNVNIFSLIGSSKGVSINTDNSKYDAENSITGEDIDFCESGYNQNGFYYIKINLNKDGEQVFKKISQDVKNGSSLYIYVDGTNYASSGISYENMISTDSSITIPLNSERYAKALALQINVLAKPVILEEVVNDVVTAGLNNTSKAFFGNESTLIILSLTTILVATFVFMCIRYRMLGLLANMSILTFVAIFAFLLQSIPMIKVDFNGLLGILTTFGLLIAGIVGIFEKIREEYKLGKKIPNSVQSGFRKNVLPTLEKYVFVLIFCAVAFFVGSVGLKNFAMTLFVGLFVNYFTLFVTLRGTCNFYLPINSTNKKAYNLTREAKNED